MTHPPARASDPVGVARLHQVIAEYLARQHPGTRWAPLPDDDTEPHPEPPPEGDK